MQERETTDALMYDGWILPEHGKSRYYTDILDIYSRSVNYYLQRHSQALCVRFNISLPHERSGYIPLVCFKVFLREYTRWLRRHDYDPFYVWVKSQPEPTPRWQLWLLLNGEKIQDTKMPINMAVRCWSRKLGLTVEEGRRLVNDNPIGTNKIMHPNGIMMERNYRYRAQYGNSFEQFSYMARTSENEPIPKGTRTYGHSEMPKDTLPLIV